MRNRELAPKEYVITVAEHGTTHDTAGTLEMPT